MDITKLSFLFWDYNITDEEVTDLLAANDLSDWRTVSLYRRILTTFPWYYVLSTLTSAQLFNALSPVVIRSIFPPQLGARYEFASRRILGNG